MSFSENASDDACRCLEARHELPDLRAEKRLTQSIAPSVRGAVQTSIWALVEWLLRCSRQRTPEEIVEEADALSQEAPKKLAAN